jgi:hypothetical protein
MRSDVVTVVSLLGLVGCVHPESMNAIAYAADPAPTEAAPQVVVADVNMAGMAGDDSSATATPRPAAALRASGADHPSPEPVLFRLGAGYGALGRIDLEPCRDYGLPSGYLRMRVTFRHTGAVAHATVESEAQPSPEVLACIGERLQGAVVPGFDGSDVTLSKSFYVAPDGRSPAVLVQR